MDPTRRHHSLEQLRDGSDLRGLLRNGLLEQGILAGLPNYNHAIYKYVYIIFLYW